MVETIIPSLTAIITMPKKPKIRDEGDRYKCGNCASAGISKRVDVGEGETKYEYPCTDCAVAITADAMLDIEVLLGDMLEELKK